MVKARELHPIQLDSDLSPEDWAERFASQAHLVSAENLHEAIGLIHRLERADGGRHTLEGTRCLSIWS